MVTGEDTRPAPRRGALTVLGLVLFGAAFLGLLVWLTRGRMHPPPPETRSQKR